MATSLTEHQIAELEATHAVGFTSQELVSAFQARGVRFSEANLRRYVQLGLVPRSRRVGRKGKNLGSRGLYPVRSVRRINAIKRLMEQRYTLEQIQEQFLAFKSAMDNLEDAVEEVLGLFEHKVDGVDADRRERLSRELGAVRDRADQLLVGVQRFEKIFTSSGGIRRPRGGGAADPEELL